MNAPEVIMKIANQSDPTSLRKRVPLSLPSPQVSDHELEDIVKVNNNLALSAATAGLMLPPSRLPAGARIGATASLIGDYTNSHHQVALPTPMRTPQQENIVLQEAHNARILREMTPFASSQAAEADDYEQSAIPQLKEGTGFAGVVPRSGRIATPSSSSALVNATPSINGSVNNTPAIHSIAGSTTGRTATASHHFGSVSAGAMALRDQLGLNISAGGMTTADVSGEGDNYSVSDVSSIGIGAPGYLSRQQEKEMKLKLSRQLKSLPEPEFVYEIAIPDVDTSAADDDDEGVGPRGTYKHIVDKADVEEQQRQAVLAHERLLEERKSTVLKKRLPRPPASGFDDKLLMDRLTQPADTQTGQRAVRPRVSVDSLYHKETLHLIALETVRLLRHDDRTHPTEKICRKNPHTQDSQEDEALLLEDLPDEYLSAAREMVHKELQQPMNGMASNHTVDPDQFNTIWTELEKSFIYSPRSESFVKMDATSAASRDEVLEALLTQFSVLRAKADKVSRVESFEKY